MEIGNVEDALGIIIKIERIIEQSTWYLENIR